VNDILSPTFKTDDDPNLNSLSFLGTEITFISWSFIMLWVLVELITMEIGDQLQMISIGK
jgi:hypothetical protein